MHLLKREDGNLTKFPFSHFASPWASFSSFRHRLRRALKKPAPFRPQRSLGSKNSESRIKKLKINQRELNPESRQVARKTSRKSVPRKKPCACYGTRSNRKICRIFCFMDPQGLVSSAEIWCLRGLFDFTGRRRENIDDSGAGSSNLWVSSIQSRLGFHGILTFLLIQSWTFQVACVGIECVRWTRYQSGSWKGEGVCPGFRSARGR